MDEVLAGCLDQGTDTVVTSFMYSSRPNLMGPGHLARSGFCLLLFVLAGCTRSLPPTPVLPAAPAAVTALGRLEPAEGIVDVGAPPGDRVASIKVKEGQLVKQGAELIYLESWQLRNRELRLAEIQLQEADRRLEAIDVSGKAQREEALLKIDQSKTSVGYDIAMLKEKKALQERQLTFAEETLQNLTSLGDTVSEQDREKQRLSVAAARAELSSTNKLLDKATKAQSQGKLEAEAQLENLDASLRRARLEVPRSTAKFNLELATDKLKQSIVTAPSEGIILALLTHPGEVTSGRPLVRMGDTRQLAAIAEVDETDILRVKVGQSARVESTTLRALVPQGLPGKVTRIGLTLGRNQVMDLNQAAQTNRRVVDVKILLDLSGIPQEADRRRIEQLIYHQVHVTIETGNEPQAGR